MPKKHLNHKKSQIHSQIFIYILTIVIMAFILTFGYKVIRDFTAGANTISCIEFRRGVQNSIKGILGDFGSVKRIELNFCPEFRKVCFVESYVSPSLPISVDPIIKDSVLSNAEKNVFLVKDIAKDSFYVGRISVDPDVLCIESVRNKVSFVLEGKGDHVFVTAK